MEDENEKKEQQKNGAMALLKKNTRERNIAEINLNYAKRKLMNTNEKHIFALGRLSNYEDGCIEEALDFAKENGMFISCDSSVIGELSHIKEYKTKAGKTFNAHFTIYNNYIGKCSELGNEPISYKGNFLYKVYEKQFEKYQRAFIEGFIKLEDLFDFTQ